MRRMNHRDSTQKFNPMRFAKSSLLNAAGEDRFVWKLLNALGQISIGSGVPGDPFSERRHSPSAIPVEDGFQPGLHAGRELKATKVTSWTQNARCFTQCPIDMGNIAQAIGDAVSVDAGVGKGQILGIADDPIDARDRGVGSHFCAAGLEHGGVEIAHRDSGFALGAAGTTYCYISSSASNVENELSWPGVHPLDKTTLEIAMQTSRHDVVHQVIAPRDRFKNALYHAGFLFGRYAFCAKPLGFGIGEDTGFEVGRRHGTDYNCSRPIRVSPDLLREAVQAER